MVGLNDVRPIAIVNARPEQLGKPVSNDANWFCAIWAKARLRRYQKREFVISHPRPHAGGGAGRSGAAENGLFRSKSDFIIPPNPKWVARAHQFSFDNPRCFGLGRMAILVPPLCHHIGSVFLLCAKEQVAGIHAKPVVTTMEDLQASG